MNKTTPQNPKDSLLKQNSKYFLYYSSMLISIICLALVMGFAISYISMLP